MKQRDIQIAGKVDSSGNLQMFMGELNEFLKKWKGHKIIASFHVSNPEASEPLKAYYFLVVVPSFVRAFHEGGEWLTQQQTDAKIRALCPVCREEVVNIETGVYNSRVKEITELDNQELVHLIDFLKQLAAEEFGVFIEDPYTYQK